MTGFTSKRQKCLQEIFARNLSVQVVGLWNKAETFPTQRTPQGQPVVATAVLVHGYFHGQL